MLQHMAWELVSSYIFPDGLEHPIAFASRTLIPSEHNYAQIEKEALALVFGMQHFHQYIYGRKFTLVAYPRKEFHLGKKIDFNVEKFYSLDITTKSNSGQHISIGQCRCFFRLTHYLTFILLKPSQSQPQKNKNLLVVIQFSVRCFTSREMVGQSMCLNSWRHFMPSSMSFQWRRIVYYEVCMPLFQNAYKIYSGSCTKTIQEALE